MGSFHRLTTPAYLGGLPATHDYINNPPGDPAQAPADGVKVGGPNEGTLFVAFGEDATSTDANRANKALAQNNDFIDDVISSELPVPTDISVTPAPPGATTTYQITDDVFVGISGTYLDTAEWRDKLIKVVDPTTGDELLGGTGTPISVSAIKDSANTNNVVGTESSGFYTNPYLTFSPAIQLGQSFRLIYGKRGSLVSMIKNKTFLDAFTRAAILGASQVSGEVERFMHEAARRSGSIQALCTAALETPGISGGDNIKPKSAVMGLYLDPDATYAIGTRQLKIGVSRDTAGRKDLLEVTEVSAGVAKLESEFTTLQLSDATTEAGAGGAVPLSSTTHSAVRIMEASDGHANLSLLECVNNKWVATCGDGVHSFGDFNGAGAISNALIYFHSNYTNTVGYGHGVRIQVKPGVYSIDDKAVGMLVGSDYFTDVVIEGWDAYNCIVDVPAGATIGGFVLGTDVHLTLKNLNLRANGGSVLAMVGSKASLHISDCVINDLQISVDKTLDQLAQANGRNNFPAVFCERTIFKCTSLVYSILYLVVSGTSSETAGYRFLDCYFAPSINNAVLRICDKAAATGCMIHGISFERCHMQLSGADVSTGDMAGVCGVIATGVPTTDIPYTAGGLTVNDISWINCTVRSAPGEDCNVLMFLRGGTGVSNYIKFETVRIQGGSWLAMAGSEILPFYIGDHAGLRGGYISSPRNVVIDDVEMGWGVAASVDYGAPAATLSGAPAVADAGAFTFMGYESVTIRRLRIRHPSVRSHAGDVYVASSGGWVDVNNILIGSNQAGEWLDTSDEGTPNHRVTINGRGVYSKIKALSPAGLTHPVVVAGYGVIRIPSTADIVELCHSEVSYFRNGEHGIFMDWADTEEVSVHDNLVKDCTGYGFHLSHDGSLVTNGDIKRLSIVHNRFINNGYYGIYIVSPIAAHAYIVREFQCDQNTCYGHSVCGIVVACGDWSTASTQSISHNICTNNNSVPENTQISIGLGVACDDGTNFCGVVMGNVCGGTGVTYDTQGKIAFSYSGANIAPACIGAETDYLTTTVGNPVTHRWSSDMKMLFNQATLLLVNLTP